MKMSNFIYFVIILVIFMFSGVKPNSFAVDLEKNINGEVSNLEENQDVSFFNKEEFTNLSQDDLYLGDKNASLVVIEYTSVTCPHCKKYHDEIFPLIKKKFIDSGKILYIIRDFPTDPISFRVAILIKKLNNCDVLQKIKIRDVVINNQDKIIQTIFDNKNAPKKAFDDVMNILKDIFVFVANISEEDFNKNIDISLPENKIIADNFIHKIGQLSKFYGSEMGAPSFLIFNKKNIKNIEKIEGLKKFSEWEQIIDKMIVE